MQDELANGTVGEGTAVDAWQMETSPTNDLSMFLCGDVMTGRGIDQALPHPGTSQLYESYVRDARDYIALAESAHGPITRPIRFDYIWGDALRELDRARVDFRIINLETSITRSNHPWPNKGIHYHMHPQNVACLTAARIDACSLANNHTLDWGRQGLTETLAVLDEVGIAHAGAGVDQETAEAPAILSAPGNGRVLLFAFGSITSGIPEEWSASRDHSGLNVLTDLSEETASRLAAQMHNTRLPGDITIASIHWGDNWGYEVPEEQILFTHRLIDEGFDLVHGHSSHHVKTIEVYRNRLILYGCGDFITDYEGITGHEVFRGDLALMYLVKMDSERGLLGLRLVPMQMRQFRLQHASVSDAEWLCALLSDLGAPLDTAFELVQDHNMRLKV